MKPIDEMTDSELNEAVAREVMEWHAESPFGHIPDSLPYMGAWYNSDQRYQIHSALWKPATEIESSWQVVEKMQTRHYWCELHNQFSVHDEMCWAGFTPRETSGWNGIPDHWTGANTVQHAICIAALKAVREAG